MEIFVFGSNTMGNHGKGAAKTALKWGAKFGQGEGLMGGTYGIPTKGPGMKTLTLDKISKYVDNFINYAIRNPQFKFLVTEIGCGLAGYKPKDIAPLFERAVPIGNIWMPASFWHKLLD